MNILITGAQGMLGTALCPVLRQHGHQVIATDLAPEDAGCHVLDVRDAGALEAMLRRERPHYVMHLAAATDVDWCEQAVAEAYDTNTVGTEHVARLCHQRQLRLLYVSTAGVFDGEKSTPYVETDAPNPVNVYGRTKLAGEVVVRQYMTHHIIVRAGWMVGGVSRDKKFAGKILRLLERRNTLSVVTDKIGTPTFTQDLAQGLATLIATEHEGTFHMANEGVCSRYDFACQLVAYLGRQDVVITPITSEAFPLPAPRAPSEAMQNQRLQSLGCYTMPAWQASLKTYVQHYVNMTNTCASSS